MVNDGFFIIRGGSFNISINKAVKLMNAKKFTVYSIVIAILLLSISEISANFLANGVGKFGFLVKAIGPLLI
jgi:hypothetical protein